jgi:hypothetical protein
MTTRRMHWLAALGVTLGLGGLAHAQSGVVWRAARPAEPAPVATLGRPVPIARSDPPKRQASGVVVRGQAPENVPPPEDAPKGRYPAPPTANPGLSDAMPSSAGEMGVTIPLTPEIDPAASTPPGVGVTPPQPPPPTATLGAERPPTPALPASHTVSGPPESVPPPPTSPVPTVGPDVTPGVFTDHPVSPGFWEKCKDWFSFGEKGSSNGRWCMGSDTSFPRMVSPVTMPFYFEDPRALTEIRPIFMYQGIPNSNPLMHGGDLIFFGSQFRLAFTERFSVVIHELGFASITPDTSTPQFPGGTGFTEFRLGPKYTFLRCPDSGTVMAGGVIFEIPTGSNKLQMDTGTLSVDPYVSIGQTFGSLPGGFGSINVLGTTGFSLSVDNKRSDFYYLNFHLDYNIANTNTIFPFFEMNWIHYINSGNANNFGFDGADLANFGSSTRKGDDYLSLAGGLRFRLAENIFAGGAIEIPVTSEKGLADYRVTLDVIFRF